MSVEMQVRGRDDYSKSGAGILDISMSGTTATLLVSLDLFNSALMNDAVYKFRRYEDSSLVYTGINKHGGEGIGLYDTVISREDTMPIFKTARLSRSSHMPLCITQCGIRPA